VTVTIATDPLTAKGERILENMEKQYGSKEKAEQVLYGSKNAGTISGIDQGALAFLGTLRNFLRGLLSWAAEEESEEEHSEPDGADRADAQPPLAPALSRELRAANDMALDRNSVRRLDADGRMHVDQSNISKATVNPYRGSEIPDAEALGLDPNRVYRLLRHPDELAKAVPTFNNLPILSEHQPVSADEHPAELVIGSTGTDAAFEPPYLKNSLVFWPQSAIDAIESGQKRELSSAYRYTADMTPGVYEGMPYDGVMRNIVGNHVACVVEGRAGHDVVVGDQKPASMIEEEKRMKLPSVVVAALKLAPDSKLAADANIEEIMPLIETLVEGMSNGNGGGMETADQTTTAPSSAVPVSSTLDADAWDGEESEEEKKAADDRRALRAADARRRLGRDETDEERDKRESEDSAADARERLGRDETDEECKAREAKDQKARDSRRGKDERAIIPSAKDQVVTKKALDAAMATARRLGADDAIRIQREIRAAERAVRPYVGDLALALDSAEAVYRTALTMLGVKTEGVHPSAFSTILAMQPLPGARPTVVALDSAGAKGFAERFPDALRVNVI
jgi:uncharacterized protein